jgi:hypothetical protein
VSSPSPTAGELHRSGASSSKTRFPDLPRPEDGDDAVLREKLLDEACMSRSGEHSLSVARRKDLEKSMLDVEKSR